MLPSSTVRSRKSSAQTPQLTTHTGRYLSDLEFASLSPAAYAWVTTRQENEPWLPAKFHVRINDALLKVAAGKIKRLVIEVPPQHGKSWLVSEFFPAWYLGEFPSSKVQLASYSASLSHEWSLRARERFREWAPLVHRVKLSPLKSQVGDWRTSEGGGVFAAGVDGSFTGRGSHVGILDDPFKNWQEAQSKVVKDHTWNWFRSSFITRLAPGAPVVIIQTRWAKDDVAGRAMDMWDNENKPYTRLTFKAIAEDDDHILKRKRGEPLWPESGRDEQFYADKMAEVGPLIFDCLFQQEPGRGEGSLFRPERFRYYHIQGDYFIAEGHHVLISDCRFFMAIDLASRTKEQNDYTVMGVFARSPTNDLFWVHVFRERISTVHHLSTLQELIKKFRATRYVLIEDVQYQQSFVDGAIQAGLPAVPVQADRDKFTRAIPLATLYYNGKVFHLKGAKWTRPLEEELVAFSGDGSSHDDQVDVGAYAAISIVEQGAAPAGVYIP